MKFTVEFSTVVEIKDGDSLVDALSCISIPEDDQTAYITDSFEIVNVVNAETETSIDPQEYDDQVTEKYKERTNDQLFF